MRAKGAHNLSLDSGSIFVPYYFFATSLRAPESNLTLVSLSYYDNLPLRRCYYNRIIAQTMSISIEDGLASLSLPYPVPLTYTASIGGSTCFNLMHCITLLCSNSTIASASQMHEISCNFVSGRGRKICQPKTMIYFVELWEFIHPLSFMGGDVTIFESIFSVFKNMTYLMT